MVTFLSAKKVPARKFKKYVIAKEDMYGGQVVDRLGKVDEEVKAEQYPEQQQQ